jgi:hypothetical protein
MAFIIGYVTEEERKELERRGWDVEDAHDYALVGPSPLQETYRQGTVRNEEVVIYLARPEEIVATAILTSHREVVML